MQSAASPRDRRDFDSHERLDACSRLVTAHPLRPGLEIYVGLERRPPRRPFGARQALVLEELVRGLTGRFVDLARTYGLLPAMQRLAPRERMALRLLLGHSSEKELAASLGLTERSAHQLVVGTYRKLGVRSRAQLMSMWIDAP